MRSERRSPPWRLAARLPVSRQARTHRTALAADTSNRSAAARRDMPPATAVMSLERRSCDKDFASCAVTRLAPTANPSPLTW